jgi:hypothetical protein
MLSKILSIQLLVENILEKRKFKVPAGYFESVHRVIDAYQSKDSHLDSEEMEGLSYLSSHPVRNLAMGLTPIHILLTSLSMEECAAMTARVIEMLSDPECQFDRTIAFLLENVQSVRQAAEGGHPALADPAKQGALRNTGVLSNILGPHRYYLMGKPMFMVDQALCEGLIQTQFGMDTPSHYLRSPLPYTYIEFGDKRDLGVFVFNEQSGLHEVEGCYIAESAYSPYMQSTLLDFLADKKALSIDSESIRYIELEFTGSPIGKSGVLDDATFSISLIVDDEAGLTVEEIYDLHVAFYQKNGHGGRLFNSLPMDNETAQSLKPLLELLIKSLIFINSDLSTRRKILDRSELDKQLAGLKNPAKRRKLMRKVNAARDYILISSKAPLEYDVAHSGQGRSVSAHWRRGHFRNQRYGEGNALVKIKWIQPVLVGVGSAQVKTYKVQE